MKVVINRCYGGFSLSPKAVKRLAELQGRECHFLTPEEDVIYYAHLLDNRSKDRADPLLVRVVEELGDEANGFCANLGIVEIPDDVEYEVEEYDGSEWVSEKHRRWE